MTTLQLPTRTAATAAAHQSIKAVSTRNPWTPVLYGTSLAAGLVGVFAALAEYAGNEALRSWLVVLAGLLVVAAFLVLAEEKAHG